MGGAGPSTTPKADGLAKASAGFEVNRGQFPSEVLYADHRASAITYFTRTGPVVVDGDRTMRLRFEGARGPFELHGEGKSSAVTNYFVGDDPKQWRRNVPSVKTVRYDDVWPGVDVRFRHNEGELEYDLLLDAGVSQTSFAIHLSGADRVRHGDDGELEIELGDRTLRKHALHGWEERPSGRRDGPVAFQIRGRDRISIELGPHDRSVPVVIDPILSYSTYLGGSDEDAGASVATLPDGGTVVVGSTASQNFIGAGAHPGSDKAEDIFITTLTAEGAVDRTTYFGGQGAEKAIGVGVDGLGGIVVGLKTTSADMPTTAGAPVRTLNGIVAVAVARLDDSTNALRFATFIGPVRPEFGAITVDASGRAFVTGETGFSTYPVSEGAAQTQIAPTGGSGAWDAVVTAVDTVNGTILFSTFLGGRGEEWARGVATDGTGTVWVTGETRATGTSFPTTPDAPRRNMDGASDVFVTKLTSRGALAFSTLFGGGGSDGGFGVAVGPSGGVFVVGRSDSPDYPNTEALPVVQPGSVGDGFATRWPADGGPVSFSAKFGGRGGDIAYAVAADSDDNVYVAGSTSSVDFPVFGGVQSGLGSNGSSSDDGFVLGLSTRPGALLFSTYLGGFGEDSLTGLGLSGGQLTVTGTTKSLDFPTRAAAQGTSGGSGDAVVAGFQLGDYDPPDTSLSSGPQDPSQLNAASFSFSSPDGGDDVRYECSIDSATIFAPCAPGVTFRALAQGRRTFRVRAIDASNNVDPTPAAYAWTVDASPPNTLIEITPPAITNQTSAAFVFTSDQADSTFECRLDGGAFGPCDPSTSFTGLTDGNHTIEARATDPAGNTDTSPATFAWRVDLEPPSTALSNTPLNPSTTTSATFDFTSPDGSTFVCKLDQLDRSPCDGTAQYDELSEGPHTFTVFAIDAAGNEDPTGVSYRWRIETTPPTGRIERGPAVRTNVRTAVLEFSSNEPASFVCRLDSRSPSPCTSPMTYADLGEGPHNFQVVATDLSGKVDPNPPIVSWRVDLTPPTAPALTAPAAGAPAELQLPAFAWAPASDEDSAMESYTLLIDGQPATVVPASECGESRCSASAPSALANGPHTWSVRSREAAGNTATSAPRAFTVDAAGPSSPDPQDPVSDAVVPASQALLRWRASTDPGSGLASYDVTVDGQVRATGLSAIATSWTTDGELANGRHEWSVTAIDRNGNRTTGASASFIIDRTAPNARFVTDPPRPYYVDQTITFDATSSNDPDGRIVRYDWDLDGDGAYERADAGPVAAHTYNVKEAGTVAVSLRVTDQAQRATSTTQLIELSSTRPGATIISLTGRTDFTRFPKVNLRISPPSGATAMQISNKSGAFGAAVTRPITKAVEIVEGWDLEPFGDPSRGTPTTTAAVYVTFLAGPIPLPGGYSGQIGVDNRPPIVTAPRVTTKSAYPLLKANVTDKGGTGVTRVQVTTSKKAPGKQAFYALPAGSSPDRINVRVTFVKKGNKADGALEIKKGAKKIYMRVEDALGNRSGFVLVKVTKGGQIKKVTSKKKTATKKPSKSTNRPKT